MFVENYSITNMLELLKNYFPKISADGSEINYFTSVEEEYNTLQHGAGIYISFDSTILKLTGKDVLDYLHRISSNSVKDLKPFIHKYTLFLNEKGRFIDRSTLIILQDYFLLIGSKDVGNRLINWLNKFIITEDIQTHNSTGDFVVIDIYGPQAESYLTLLLGDELKSLNENNILATSIDGISFFVFSQHATDSLMNYRVLIDNKETMNLIEYMLNNKSVFDVNIVGSDAFNIFRIEQGIPLAPYEINDEFNPHENNLIHEVSFTKGCYIGQEVIARLDTYDKIQRKMFGVVFSNQLNESGKYQIITENGEEAGEITSTSFADFMNQPIGLGFLRKKFIGTDNSFFINDGQKQVPITIKELQFKS